MKIGIMQPYFFPYLGYFDAVNRVDQWIVFDTPQYVRHSWMNRNRILHPEKGWQYIVVPVKKHSRNTPLMQIEVSDSASLPSRILSQLEHYRRRAPFFSETESLIRKSMEIPFRYLVQLNVAALRIICSYLDIPFNYTLFSRFDKALGAINGPGDWALEISKAVGASEYVNPPGGSELFDVRNFADAGIKLTITNLIDFKYDCQGYEFIPHLSIIDVLMWNHPHAIKEYLDVLT